MGICSGINLSPDLAFIGQFGVRPEYQRLGIGSELWRKAIEHIGSDRNIGLYARKSMVEKYRNKYNFTFIPGRTVCFFVGKVDFNQLIQAIDGISVIPISDHNIEKVIQYDKEVCDGLDRSASIQEMIKISEYVNAVAVNQLNEVLGYCVIQISINCNKGVVKPLYANDEKIAELLLSKCCQSMANIKTNGLIIPTFNTNTKSISIAKRLGLDLAEEAPILFNKRIVSGNLDCIYCITSPCFYPF